MSNKDCVIEFLRNMGHAGATNEQIVSHTGIKPHQQVFAITREPMQRGRIKGIQTGKEWRFWIVDSQSLGQPTETRVVRPQESESQNGLTPADFQGLVLVAMSKVVGAPLAPVSATTIPRRCRPRRIRYPR
jgi:hypothetical protein